MVRRILCLVSAVVLCGLWGCSNDELKPEDSIADQLKAAKIDPNGKPKDFGAVEKKDKQAPPPTQ